MEESSATLAPAAAAGGGDVRAGCFVRKEEGPEGEVTPFFPIFLSAGAIIRELFFVVVAFVAPAESSSHVAGCWTTGSVGRGDTARLPLIRGLFGR